MTSKAGKFSVRQFHTRKVARRSSLGSKGRDADRRDVAQSGGI